MENEKRKNSGGNREEGGQSDPEEVRIETLQQPSEEEGEESQEDEICPICEGTGEVAIFEAVYPGEPHMAPIGVRTCECQVEEDDDDYYEERFSE